MKYVVRVYCDLPDTLTNNNPHYLNSKGNPVGITFPICCSKLVVYKRNSYDTGLH